MGGLNRTRHLWRDRIFLEFSSNTLIRWCNRALSSVENTHHIIHQQPKMKLKRVFVVDLFATQKNKQTNTRERPRRYVVLTSSYSPPLSRSVSIHELVQFAKGLSALCALLWSFCFRTHARTLAAGNKSAPFAV